MKFRITHISDTHNKHNKLNLPGGDILIHSGDISSIGRKHEVEKFIEKLPKATLDAIRKHFVNQVTSGTARPQKSPTSSRKGAEKSYKGTTDSFFDKLEQKFG